MRTKEQILSAIEESAMVAVVRGETSEQAMEIVEKCIAGGIKAVELTFTVPFAHRVIEDLARKYGDQIILGAGTVLDSETARIAILSGAEFIVSPHFNEGVVKCCNRYRKASMQGILTITEAVTAMEAGTDVLKLFPGELFGPAFIKAIKGPLPYARIMPTGGVSVDNVAEWIKAGAVAVGAGSSLMKGDVKANAEAFMKNIREARGL